MSFVKDILKADPEVDWTGFRITGTVNRSSGYTVFTIEVFAKHPDSSTKVYSNSTAPNVDVEWLAKHPDTCNYEG